MAIEIGDTVDNSIWLDGNETPEMRKQFERDVEDAIDYFCYVNGMEHGPVTWTEKHPEDADVPPVPDHIQGERVRLLFASTTIIGKRVQTSIGSFIGDLDKKDHELLRKITRRAMPNVTLNDNDVDALIEELGPEAAMDAVRKHYKKRLH